MIAAVDENLDNKALSESVQGIVRQYETMLVIDYSIGEETIQNIVEKFKSIIEQNGKIESTSVWGRRKLAYPINHKKEGFYVLINFSSDTNFPKELDRVYKITENLLRTIIVRREVVLKKVEIIESSLNSTEES